jgi:DNA polymerase
MTFDESISNLAQSLAAHLERCRQSYVKSLPERQELQEEKMVAAKEENLAPALMALRQGTESAAVRLLRLQNEIIGDCKRCKLCEGRNKLVFGVGDPGARLLFVGEGPGAEEDRQGEPFVGRAGQLLTKMIEAMGLSRSQIYICNVVKCRPPDNRDPEPDEVLACDPFLKAQIAIIKPQVIVALGRYACQTLLSTKTPMSQLRGQWAKYEGVDLMPTFHPAFLLRNPPKKKEVWADLQQVMQRLK